MKRIMGGPLLLVPLCVAVVFSEPEPARKALISKSGNHAPGIVSAKTDATAKILGKAAGSSVETTTHAAQRKIAEEYGKLPLSFELNEGQADRRVQFISRGRGYSVFLTGSEEVLALRKPRAEGADVHAITPTQKADGEKMAIDSVAMKFVGAQPAPSVEGVDELRGKVNYFVGDDPKLWRTNVPTYGRVRYKDVYPGVDVVFYGNEGKLEYDFAVAPGASTSAIKFQFDGTKEPKIDSKGDLLLRLGASEARLQKPVVYQEWEERQAEGRVAKIRETVEGRYQVAANVVSFELGKYDRRKPLVIDPVLLYATYLGGNGNDYGEGIAVDGSGNAYVTGYTYGVPNPTTGFLPYVDTFPLLNPIQSNFFEECAFVSEINAAGTALVYSTFLCDANGSNYTPASYGRGIAVDTQGNAYVVGDTYSDGTPHFPTVNALQATAPKGSNAFVAKIAAGGASLVYSTYLGGGNEYGDGIAVDSEGNAYVTGSAGSTSFPTFHPLQASLRGAGPNAFISKINPTGSAFVYSTYLGGSTNVPNPAGAAGDKGKAIAVDAAGDAYVTGITASSDFPTQNAMQSSNGGDYDAFVTEINPTGSALVYSTYLGGSGGDQGLGIALDSKGDAFVTGTTTTTNERTPNALPCTLVDGGQDAFVAEVTAGGSSLGYWSYLTCNPGPNIGYGIVLDPAGDVYVAGTFGAGTQGSASFLAEFVITATNTQITYSTGLGSNVSQATAITMDNGGNVYVTGSVSGTGFASFDALQTTPGGGNDAFLAKVGNANVAATTLILSPATVAFGTATIAGSPATQAVTLANTGANPAGLTTVTASGDYAVTGSNCPPEVLPATNCTITVTFTPTASGTRTGTLTVTDSATNSPQTASLTGVGAYQPISLSGGSVTAQFPLFTQWWAVTVSNGGPGIAVGTAVSPVSITPLNASGDPSSPNYCAAFFASSGGGFPWDYW